MMPNKLLPSLLSLTLIVGLGWAAEGIVTVKPQKGVRLSPEDVPSEITPIPFLSGDTLLYENFDGDWGPYGDNPPSGWTIIANGGDNNWNENDWHRFTYYVTDVAFLYQDPIDTGEDILMSPVINCCNHHTVKLHCLTYYYHYTGSYTAVIEGSTDGGATWAYTIRDYNDHSFGPANETIDLPWADGNPNVRIRWRGNGIVANIKWWMVDDIILTADSVLANDVAVTNIISPPNKEFWAFGDTLYPVVEIKNYGANPQPLIPVRCLLWDTITKETKYDEVVFAGPLEHWEVDTVEFPPFIITPHEAFLIDTIRTKLANDERPDNDVRFMSHLVSEWGWVWMKNHNGDFENAITYISPDGEWASRFAQAPHPNLTLNQVGMWNCSGGNYTYPAQIRIYGWTGTKPKDVPIATKDVTINTVPWPNFYHNIHEFKCAVPDSPLVVSYKQISVVPPYPYIALDYNEPIDDDDAWTRPPTWWDHWYTLRDFLGYHCDLSLEAAYEVRQIDAALKGFPFPDTLNSDTVINFAIEVKNAGLVARNNIKVNMFFIHDPDGETLFALAGNTGPINTGQTKTVSFPDTWRTQPGKYIFAGYTQLLYDKNYENDSCQQAIFILNGSGVAEGGFRNAGCRSWFTLLPNPLTKGYGLLSYSVPQAGNARLKVFDITGRTVMSLSFVASHSGEKRLDLRRLSAGVYWVKFETPSEEAIQKLIIR